MLTKDQSEAPGLAHLYLREEQLRATYEGMLLAWRELDLTLDALPAPRQLGAAHHRVLFLVATHPFLTMTELLGLLNVAKQSLSRVLKELISRGYVIHHQDDNDRRVKRLSLSEAGKYIEQARFNLLKERMTLAYRTVDGRAVDGFRRVLQGFKDVGGKT